MLHERACGAESAPAAGKVHVTCTFMHMRLSVNMRSSTPHLHCSPLLQEVREASSKVQRLRQQLRTVGGKPPVSPGTLERGGASSSPPGKKASKGRQLQSGTPAASSPTRSAAVQNLQQQLAAAEVRQTLWVRNRLLTLLGFISAPARVAAPGTARLHVCPPD